MASTVKMVARASIVSWAAIASTVEMALLATEVREVSEALLALEATEAPPASLVETAQTGETALRVSSVQDITEETFWQTRLGVPRDLGACGVVGPTVAACAGRRDPWISCRSALRLGRGMCWQARSLDLLSVSAAAVGSVACAAVRVGEQTGAQAPDRLHPTCC